MIMVFAILKETITSNSLTWTMADKLNLAPLWLLQPAAITCHSLGISVPGPGFTFVG